jgi:hypothetical protein
VAQPLPPLCPNAEVTEEIPLWLCWGKLKQAGMAEDKAHSGTWFLIWECVREDELEFGARWVGFPLLECAGWIEIY